uniref:Uncharacterized protein n=1 Tax=Rhizophora mucronata TaxID=61149 RepID=A0A2P2L647_RHIMU
MKGQSTQKTLQVGKLTNSNFTSRQLNSYMNIIATKYPSKPIPCKSMLTSKKIEPRSGIMLLAIKLPSHRCLHNT